MEATTFEDLVTETEESYKLTIDQIDLALVQLANGLREHAKRGADLPVAPDQEEAKRINIRLWRQIADHIDPFIRHALKSYPTSGEQLRDEIRDSLMSAMRDFCTERAANIAQGLMGRVLPEPSVNQQEKSQNETNGK